MHWRATVQCIVVERRKTDHLAVMKESKEVEVMRGKGKRRLKTIIFPHMKKGGESKTKKTHDLESSINGARELWSLCGA